MEKIYFNGKEYGLKPKTMKVARMIDATEQAQSVTEAYKGEYDVIIYTLGKDAVKAILGTSNIEEIDLTQMVKVYNAVIDAYDKELAEEQRRREAELLDSDLFDKLDRLAKNAQVISELAKTNNVT